MIEGTPSSPRSATGARSDNLAELTHGLRAELLRRGEFLPSAWVEEAARDLRSGRLIGWVLGAPAPSALLFYSRRGARVYSHAHVRSGPDSVSHAVELLQTLVANLPADVVRAEVGITGLTEAEEGTVAERVRGWPGASVLERLAMDRSVRPVAPDESASLPEGVRRIPVRDIPLEAIATLDWAGFQETADASLVADTVGEDQEVLAEIVEGRLGRFLDDASTTLVAAPGHLIGVLLTAEQSPHRAVFLDLVVHPSRRRSGLATALLRFGFRATAALGYDEVRLWVTAANLPARRLYEREGFRPALRR